MNTLSTINNPLGDPVGSWAAGRLAVDTDDQGQDSDPQRKRLPSLHGAAECFW